MQNKEKKLTLFGLILQSFKINFNAKDVLNFSKDHFNLIVIVPPILGGIWQIIELYNISPAFIRFFSISQIIPDGIIILLIILMSVLILLTLVVIISLFFGVFPRKLLFIDEKDLNEEKEETTQKSYRGIIVNYILAFLFIFISFKYLVNLQIISEINLIVYFTLSVMIINHACGVVSKSVQMFPDKFSGYIRLIYLPIIYLMFLLFLSFSKGLKEQMLLPDIFTNPKTLLKKYKTDKRIWKNEILYMNDKYIFIKNHLSTEINGKKVSGFCISTVKFEDLVSNSYEKNAAQTIQLE